MSHVPGIPSFFAIRSLYPNSGTQVALGLPDPGKPIDVWSAGCVLAELHTGRPLFPARTEADLVQRHLALLGPPPHAMLGRGARTPLFFEVVPVATEGGGHHNVFMLKNRPAEILQNTFFFSDLARRCICTATARTLIPAHRALCNFMAGRTSGSRTAAPRLRRR